MAKINGTLVLFQIGETPATLAHVTNATFSIDADIPESTDKDSSGYRELLENAGVRSGTITSEGFADWSAADGNAKTLAEAVLDRTNIGFAFGPEGVDFWQITGECRATTAELGAPNEDTAPLSGNFETTGEFTIVDNS
jgi:predicted secreted protein